MEDPEFLRWKEIDLKAHNVEYTYLPRVSAFITLGPRRLRTILDVFLIFFTNELIGSIFDSLPDEELAVDPKSRVYLRKEAPLLLKCIAVSIFIQAKGRQFKGSQKPLELAVRDAMESLGVEDLPSIKYVQAMISKMIIRPSMYPQLSLLFQSIVQNYGQSLACDEKLFRFTGKSSLTRYVPSKPDIEGFWIYESVGLLANRCPYVVYLRLHDSGAAGGGSIPTSSVVKDWVGIIQNDRIAFNPDTTLIMDAYYLDNASRIFINNQRPPVRVIASVNKQRFPDINFLVNSANLKIKGFKVYQKEGRSEILTVYNCHNQHLGLKSTLSTAHRVKNRSTEKGKIPIFEDCGSMFNYCDKLSQNLFESTWPYRHGGGRSYGEAGRLHDFAFTCILKNTYHVHILLEKINPENCNFFEKCEELARQLFVHANSL